MPPPKKNQPKISFLEMAHTNFVSSIRQRAYQPLVYTKDNKNTFSTFQTFFIWSFPQYFEYFWISYLRIFRKLNFNISKALRHVYVQAPYTRIRVVFKQQASGRLYGRLLGRRCGMLYSTRGAYVRRACAARATISARIRAKRFIEGRLNETVQRDAQTVIHTHTHTHIYIYIYIYIL